jgi:threonine aldolase
MPTGTMANQLAIKLLNENNTKVIVPENSHIFRDEADAAQAVHSLRLVPVGKGKPFFDLNDLKKAMQYYESGEVFKSGLGTIVVEHPVRRANGTAVPFETIQEISQYCRSKGLKLHLDGARLHIAAAYTKIPISEYADCFDTVYISLYKYLNASSGAMLCASRELIRKIRHLIKIMGGTTYQNWNTSAMALDSLKRVDKDWKSNLETSDQLFDALNRIEGIEISKIENGTNIYDLRLDSTIDSRVLSETLRRSHKILIRPVNGENQVKVLVNESILGRPVEDLIRAWQLSVRESRLPMD